MIGRVLQLPLVLSLVLCSGEKVKVGTGSLEADQQQRPIARREPLQRPTQVLVDAAGELVEKDDPTKAPSPLHAEPLGDEKTCNMDYVEGPANGLECADTTHTPMTDSAVCTWAASVTGTPVMDPKTFRIDHANFSQHPRGCIKMPCSDGNATECYFFNDDDDESYRAHDATVQGTPVCSRDKYTNGTVDGTACYSVYSLISTDTECSNAAECLGYPAASKIRIDEDESNTKHYDLFPQGCFIMKSDQKVYFNAFTSTMAAPTGPVGTPICKVPGVTG